MSIFQDALCVLLVLSADILIVIEKMNCIFILSIPSYLLQKGKDRYYYNQYNYYQYYYRVIFTLPEMSKRHFLKCHNHTCRSVNSQVTDRKG